MLVVIVYVDDEFSKPAKKCLGGDADYKFINDIVEKSKHCGEIMKKEFKKDLTMTMKDQENFGKAGGCWICGLFYVDDDVKEENIVMQLENLEVLLIDIVILIWN